MLVAELTGLVGEHRLWERPCWQLMLVLASSGHQDQFGPPGRAARSVALRGEAAPRSGATSQGLPNGTSVTPTLERQTGHHWPLASHQHHS